MGYITNSGRECNKIRGGGDQSQCVQKYYFRINSQNQDL